MSYRFAFLFLGTTATGGAHMLKMSVVTLLAAALDCRLASATTFPRALPTTALALLNHMLMNGFFFNQGFDMTALFLEPCRRCDGCQFMERCASARSQRVPAAYRLPCADDLAHIHAMPSEEDYP